MEPEIYKPDREWRFIVKKSNTPGIDTLKLNTIAKSDTISEITGKWEIVNYDTSGNMISRSTTTSAITENRIMGVGNFLSISKIKIPDPSIGNLGNLVLAPAPQVNLPVKNGYVDRNYHHHSKIVKKKRYDSAGKELPAESEPLDDVKITGSIEVTGKTYFDNPVIQDTCWVVEAVGRSKIDTVNSAYYFNEKAGFVYFKYDFGDQTIEIVPISINFLTK